MRSGRAVLFPVPSVYKKRATITVQSSAGSAQPWAPQSAQDGFVPALSSLCASADVATTTQHATIKALNGRIDRERSGSGQRFAKG